MSTLKDLRRLTAPKPISSAGLSIVRGFGLKGEPVEYKESIFARRTDDAEHETYR